MDYLFTKNKYRPIYSSSKQSQTEIGDDKYIDISHINLQCNVMINEYAEPQLCSCTKIMPLKIHS